MASVKEAKVRELERKLELAERTISEWIRLHGQEMDRRIKAEKQLLKQQRDVKWQ